MSNMTLMTCDSSKILTEQVPPMEPNRLWFSFNEKNFNPDQIINREMSAMTAMSYLSTSFCRASRSVLSSVFYINVLDTVVKLWIKQMAQGKLYVCLTGLCFL